MLAQLSEILELLVLTVLVWYLGQRIVAVVLTRRATAFCPNCLSGYLETRRHAGWKSLVPFVPFYSCHDCGVPFLRGRKPPFAACPGCRRASLDVVSTGTLAGHVRIACDL